MTGAADAGASVQPFGISLRGVVGVDVGRRGRHVDGLGAVVRTGVRGAGDVGG